MLPKAHLTSHSRMSGSRWVITASWLSESWRSFLYSSSAYSCHLFLMSSASVRSLPFLSFVVAIFAWNVPLVSLVFLKRSLVYHSIVFLYFFAFITEEGFLLSLKPCIQMVLSFLFSFAFHFPSMMTQICQRSAPVWFSTYCHKDFPGYSDSKQSSCNMRNLGLIPGSGRSPEEGNDYPLHYSYLENAMDRGAWLATVHGVAKSQTQLVTNTHVLS